VAGGARVLLAGDLAGVLKELHNGLASAEHAAFVEPLSNALGAFHAAS
jgi:hypothetical protein